MKIVCKDTDTMLEVTYGLVTRGIQFAARQDEDQWIIELTGGF